MSKNDRYRPVAQHRDSEEAGGGYTPANDVGEGDGGGGEEEMHHDLTHQTADVETYDDDDLYDGMDAGGRLGRVGNAFRRLRATLSDGDLEEKDAAPLPQDASSVADGFKYEESRSSTPTTSVTTADTKRMESSAETFTTAVQGPTPLQSPGPDEANFEGPGLKLHFDSDLDGESEGGSSSESDFDDEENGIHRYAQFDFTQHTPLPGASLTESDRIRSQSVGSRADLLQTPLRKSFSTSSSATTDIVTNPVRGVIERVRSARIESRRRRAERLLSLPDEARFARMLLCLSSWCDMTERGFWLIGLVIVAFVVACKSLDAEENARTRSLMLLIGVPLIVFRVCWRPVYWGVWGRHIERRRRETMEMYDGLNGADGTGGTQIPMEVIGDDHHEDDDGMRGIAVEMTMNSPSVH